MSGPPARLQIEEILTASERASGLTRQLMAFARRGTSQPLPVRINAVVAGTAKMLRQLLGEDVLLEIQPSPTGGPVVADPAQIQQILLHVARNARDAMPGGGCFGIRVSDEEEGDGAQGQVVLALSDTGVGMSEETRSKAFEPFFTTKGPAGGTGLGLSTVYAIVEQLGGNVELELRGR